MSITLQEVIDALTLTNDHTRYFYDREKDEIVMLLDQTFAVPDPEMKKLARAVKRTPDRFAEIPVLSPGEQYQAMQAFISTMEDEKVRTMEDEKVRGMFQRQTQGPECFQRFYIMVEGFGYSKAWELFQSLIYEGVAREWCRENRIGVAEDEGSFGS